MTCLLKLEPGAHIPFHKHPEIEQSLVLEGSVEDHDGIAMAGDYVWRESGSLHDNKSPGGAVLFAVYRKPNIYYHTAKEKPRLLAERRRGPYRPARGARPFFTLSASDFCNTQRIDIAH
jgi:anti-sigma factor ChrR (cupin superfamily)